MLRLFIIQWLLDYINTPKIEMSLSTELLGILSIGIIAFLILGAGTGIAILIDYFKNRRKEK
jgi:hypothetical protein